MDHAEVLDRIEASVTEPRGQLALVADTTPEAAALRDHIRACPSCAAEWRAWSVVTLGLAAAAPDGLALRPEARQAILGAVLARPSGDGHPAQASARAPAAGQDPQVTPPAASPTWTGGDAPGMDTGAPSGPVAVPGVRTARANGMTAAASRAARTSAGTERKGPGIRWLLAAAAVAAVVFVAGAALGRPLGLIPSDRPESDLPAVMGKAADILQGQGRSIASLQTPDRAPGGVVAVSPGSGELVVLSRALMPLPDGVRYACYLERDGQRTKIGYMRFEDDLAFWAGPITEPSDAGRQGDIFLVIEDTPNADPALAGTF